MKLPILLLISLGFVAISLNTSDALQYKRISFGRLDRKRANQRRQGVAAETAGTQVSVKEEPSKKNDEQTVLAALFEAIPQLQSSLQSNENRDDYHYQSEYEQYSPVINPVKALIAKLAYGFPVLLGYFKVFTYLNALCTDNNVCTNVTVTATSTRTNTATTTAMAVSIGTSSITKLFTTTLLDTTTSTSMPTVTTTFTDTTSTSLTSTRTRTTTITSSTAETFTSSSTSITTSTTSTATTTTFTSTSITSVNPGGRFMEIFGDNDDDDIFNFDYRPVAKIDTSALPELGSSEEVVSSILEGEDEDSSASQDEDWSDYDTSLPSPSPTNVELSSSIEPSI